MAEMSAVIRRWLMPALGLVLVGLGAIWYFFLLQWEEYEVDLGYSPEARRNPYLAAQQFLEAREHPVRVLSTFAPLDGMAFQDTPLGLNDLVILVNARGALPEGRRENLWRWLEAGGHLVVSGRNSFIDVETARRDPLLERLGIALTVGTEEAGEDSAEEVAVPQPASDEKCGHLTSTGIQPRSGPAFRLARLQDYAFVDSRERALLWRDGSHPPQYLRFRQGGGTATVTADNRIWENGRIACFDHAYALALLAKNRERVWILVNADAPSLWRVLWQAVPVAVVAFGMALLFWLWARGKRFAPAVPRVVSGRRSFLEHLHASAVFLWRHRLGQRLIIQLRQDLLQRVARRHPGFADWEVAEQTALVSERSGLSLSDTERALHGPLPTTPADFALVVSRLQHIRNQL